MPVPPPLKRALQSKPCSVNLWMSRASARRLTWPRRLHNLPAIHADLRSISARWSIRSARAHSGRPPNAHKEEQHEQTYDSCDDQRHSLRGYSRGAHAAGPLAARRPAPDWHAYRLRYLFLRSLHDSRRWQGDEVLHDVRRAGRWTRVDDRRGAGTERPASSLAGRLPRKACAAMRLLHTRHDDGRPGLAAKQPSSN